MCVVVYFFKFLLIENRNVSVVVLFSLLSVIVFSVVMVIRVFMLMWFLVSCLRLEGMNVEVLIVSVRVFSFSMIGYSG